MGIFKRPDSKFWWVWPEGGKPFSSKILIDGGTPIEQRERRKLALQQYHTAMTAPPPPEPAAPTETIPTCLELCAHYRAHDLPLLGGKKREDKVLARWERYFGDVPFTDITRRRIAVYRTERVEHDTRTLKSGEIRPIKASTINKEVRILQQVLSKAVEHELISHSPLYGMKRLRETPAPSCTLTHEETERVLKELSQPDQALFLMGQDTLVRLGNLLDLQWREVHLADATARILRPKDPRQSKPYTVPLSARVVEALEALPRNGPYVFHHRRVAKNP